jgi:hypothetical protein
MGCKFSQFEDKGESFIDDILFSFPLSIYNYENMEDIYEKNLDNSENIDDFRRKFKLFFEKSFESNEKYKDYHYLILDLILKKIGKYFNNFEIFKYHFFLYIYPLLNHSVSKSEILDGFKEITIFLCDFKKTQIEIVKDMQNFLFNYFYFISYEIPFEICVFINDYKKKDIEYKILIENKLNFFDSNKINDKVNKMINEFFAIKRKMSLSNSLSESLSTLPLNYFDILKQFG